MSEYIKVLLLEDEESDAEFVQRVLTKYGMSFSLTVVDTKEKYTNALYEFKPDVILSDHTLPNFDSTKAFKIYKEYEKQTDKTVPFILVTGTVSEEFAVQCIKNGVDDYILKDRLERLPSAMESAMEKKKAEIENKKAEDEKNRLLDILKKSLNEIYMFNPDTLLFEFVNDGALKNLGYSEAEIYKMTPLDIMPDFNEADFRSVLSEIERSASPKKVFETIHLRKDYSVYNVEVHLELIRQHKGNTFLAHKIDITEKKKAAIALQKSEQEYKSLFDQNPEAVFSLNLEGKFKNVNDALLKIAALGKEELLKLDFKSFLADNDAEKFDGHFLTVIKGIPQRYEVKFNSAKGKEFVLDVTNMPIVVNEEIVGIHVVAKDITQRRYLENLLNEVQRVARIGGWEVDMSNKKVNWTKITREIHEVSSDFQISLDEAIVFYKEGKNRDAISFAIKEAIETGASWDLELQIVTAKGNERWVRAIGETEFKNGQCVRLFGSFQDINLRKQAELELIKQQHEILRIKNNREAMINSTEELIFSVDAKFNLISANRAFLDKIRNVTHLNINEGDPIVIPDLNEEIEKRWKNYFLRALQGEQFSVTEEVQFNNVTYYSLASFNPIRDNNVCCIGVACFIKNITERMVHIQEIEDQNKRLQDIAWTQSHIVRAPVARIKGLVNLLNMHDEETSQDEVLQYITYSADELDNIIEDIVKKTQKIIIK